MTSSNARGLALHEIEKQGIRLPPISPFAGGTSHQSSILQDEQTIPTLGTNAQQARPPRRLYKIDPTIQHKPPPGFRVREATLSDVDNLTQLYFTSFLPPHQLWDAVTPGDSTRKWWNDNWAMGIKAGPEVIMTFVVEDLAENNKIVAFMRWHVPQANKSRDIPMPEFPPEWDASLTEALWGVNDQARAELMGRKAHWMGEFVGVNPLYQGKGLAQMLLHWGCQQADAFGLDIYGDASLRRLSFFKKYFGFEDRKRQHLPVRVDSFAEQQQSTNGAVGDTPRLIRMSLPRVFSPLLSAARQSLAASPIKSRYRPSPRSSLPSICASYLRRSLQTATPYRPETLDLPAIDPAPPRNKDAPKSELTAKAPDGKPPPFTSSPVDSISTVRPAAPSISTLPFTSPTSPSPQSPSPTTSTPSAPRKLRPRKAAMTLTPPAVDHLRSLTQQTPPKLIRVGVKQKGCSGLAYHLEYIEKPGRFDEVVDQDGVKVYIDSKALFSIIGSEMDWVEDQLSARFVFNNPNIKEECGCGESFMVHS
ncbi:hypothetical protein Dda_4398 [Drechslerella dactyloides]|uniref:Iron-sulfur assembly protein 1 n=1 Tax=Drechslerella dactyloides TaxID=74499 RepID=A0AAD6IZ22_DREDA|nr:hypothetical protein Dda_4398 [Drechslerella dactyloides]